MGEASQLKMTGVLSVLRGTIQYSLAQILTVSGVEGRVEKRAGAFRLGGQVEGVAALTPPTLVGDPSQI